MFPTTLGSLMINVVFGSVDFPFFFCLFLPRCSVTNNSFSHIFFSLVKCFLLDASARDSLEPFLEFFACTPSHHKPTLTFSQTAHYFFPSTFGVSHFFSFFGYFYFGIGSHRHTSFLLVWIFFGRFKKVKGERKRKKKTPGWELNARTTNGGRKKHTFLCSNENKRKQNETVKAHNHGKETQSIRIK